MPGSLCNGVPTDQPMKHESNAYCRGVAYRAGGTAAARPKTDNPFDETGRPVDHASWDRGWDLADAAAGGTLDDPGCCAGRGMAISA